MFRPIEIYEPIFILPEKSELKNYNKELYKLDLLIEEHQFEIESEMQEAMINNARKRNKKDGKIDNWKLTKNTGRKWYSLIFRFKVLLVMHLNNTKFRDMVDLIKNNIWVRIFLGISNEKQIPKHVAIHNWNCIYWEDFIKSINKNIVIKEAKKKKIVKWNRSRTDTTVVEENVSFPTDSILMKKAKELIIRSVKRISEWTSEYLWNWKSYFKEKAIKWWRKLRKAYFGIEKYAKSRKEEAKEKLKGEYNKMIDILKDTVKYTVKYMKDIKISTKRASYIIKTFIKKEYEELEILTKKIVKVINQADKRINYWEMVKMPEKLISFFSDKATIIKKGKTWKNVELWRKLQVVEVENWIVASWSIEDWNPNDATLTKKSIEWLKDVIWKVPKNNAYDRWYYDKNEITEIEEEYWIKLHIPKRGKKTKEDEILQNNSIYKKYVKWRSWWEWKISILKRRAWIRHLRVRWDNSVKINVWWKIVSDNLRIIGKFI